MYHPTSQTLKEQSKHAQHLTFQCYNPSCKRRVKAHIRSDRFKSRHAGCQDFKKPCTCEKCHPQLKKFLKPKQQKQASKINTASQAHQTFSQTELTKASEADIDDISLAMPDELMQQINDCIKRYSGADDNSIGHIQKIVYKVGGKRLMLNYDMQQPVEIAGLRMTALQAQRNLAYPDYVKAILAKSDEEKAKLRLEMEHRNAAKIKENQRLENQKNLDQDVVQGNSSESESEVGDFNEAMKSIEENRLQRRLQKIDQEDQLDWNNPKDFIRLFFFHFSEKRRRKTESQEDDACETMNDYTEWLNKKYQEELELLRQHTKRQNLMSDEEFESKNDVIPFRKYTSLDPENQWRRDNLSCVCGNCHHFSGTKKKNCWVFMNLGCNFSASVLQYFTFEFQPDSEQSPIFDPETRQQQLPLLLKDSANITWQEFKRMRTQSGILSIVQFRYNLRQIWKAIQALNISIRQIKQRLGRVTNTNRHQSDPDTLMKRKILRTRIRSFEQSEVRRIMKFCTHEIWDQLRNPKTGKYLLDKLKVQVGDKEYTLFPTNRRIPKRRTKKIQKAFKYGLQFSRLFKQERTQKFREFVSEQLERIHKGQNVMSFKIQYDQKVERHVENKDMSLVSLEKMADQELRRLVLTPKIVSDQSSEQSLSDKCDSEKGSDSPDDDSDEISDTMSVKSDMTFFKFQKETALDQLKKHPLSADSTQENSSSAISKILKRAK